MSSVTQNLFRSAHCFPDEIPFQHYPSRNVASAIDHLISNQVLAGSEDKTIVFGVSHRLSVKGNLQFLCISTRNRAAIIRFDDFLIPSTKQEGPLTRLLDSNKFTLVGFDLAKTALYLNSLTLLQTRGVDLSAVIRDPKSGRAFSAADIVKRTVPSTVDEWKIVRLWNNEQGQMVRDLCLQAWLAYCVADRCPNLETMVRIDTSYLNRSELALLTQMIKETDTLEAVKPAEATGDFASATVDKEGHIKLVNSRYKTRIKRSQNAKIILTDSSGKDHWGNAAAARGRTTTISLHSKPARDLVFQKVRVYGRPEALNHEKARDTLLIHLLTGVKNLRDAPFIRALWFPTWKPIFFTRGSGGVSVGQAEILLRDIRLNDSQKRAALSLVSEDRLIIVHGPPGTGKTTTISAAAKVWHAHRRPTWIVAHSNVAVKNIAASLYKHNVQFKLIVSKDFHFEWHEHLYEQISERMIRSDEFTEDTRLTEHLFSGIHIVLCTLSMLSNPVLENCGLLDIVPLERLVIDEASQINAFEYLHIFDKYTRSLEKVCYFGDPFQLPPFGKTDAPTIQTIFDFKKVTPHDHFLDTQYRMPTPIGDFISRTVYSGRLKSQHPITNPDCVKFIDVQSCEEKGGFSWKNSREADIMVYLVKQYYSTKNFCIITPYDAQRALIHARLENANLPNDTVYNLDSFQGNEADYILVSVVRTSQPGFLRSLERLNVLLTRAKKGLIIVTNKPFLKSGGSGTLLGKIARYWGDKYKTSSHWVDWRLVAQNEASLPGELRAAPQSPNPHLPGQTQRTAYHGSRSQPRVFSVNGRSLNKNLFINDAAQWPVMKGANPSPAAVRPTQWPSKATIPSQAVQQAQGKKKSKAAKKTNWSANIPNVGHVPLYRPPAYIGYRNPWTSFTPSVISSSPITQNTSFSYGLYQHQQKAKPRKRF